MKKKKGRIVSFQNVKYINEVRQNLPLFFGEKAKHLVGELNYYYDISKCGIGYHGDSERMIVIALRLGESIPLHYNWYLKGQPIGKHFHTMLNHGDLYMMSEKAVGNDWRKQKIPTLRHAAGCNKYTTIKLKKVKQKKNNQKDDKSTKSTIDNYTIKSQKKKIYGIWIWTTTE